jgi:hypothetical protein
VIYDNVPIFVWRDLGKPARKLTQHSRSPCRDLNPVPTEQETEV